MKTIYIVLIVLGAIFMLFIVPFLVGVSWVITRNAIEGGQDQINPQQKCNEIIIKITKIKMIPTNMGAEVTIIREVGGSEIAGIKLIFNGSEGNNFIYDVPGNINELEQKEIIVNNMGFEPNRVEVSAYFLDKRENERICSPISFMEIR